MQNLLSLAQKKAPHLFLFLGIALTSCTSVYFEKPVPQQGTALTTIPADWVGIYFSEPVVEEDATPLEQIIRPCFRLERIGTTQLLVSSEYRIHERDMPRLKTALEKQESEGELLKYYLTESMLWYTVRVEDREEQQYSGLTKTGSWYILTQTIAPFRLFDLDAGIQTEFELEKQAGLVASGLPEADSISSKTSALIAKKDRNAWYFNTRADSNSKWSLMYIRQVAPDQLTIKISHLEHPDDFKNRLEYFNTITQFREIASDNFLIDPDDAALSRLLAEDGLFQTTHLRRIED